MPESTSPQALQDTPTTPWAGLPIPPGRRARLSIPAVPAGNSDHPLGWTPHPPRPVCLVLRPHRPCRTLRPPPGQNSPSPQAGVPESTSPQAQRCTPTTPWAGLPVPPGWCARIYIPTGPAGRSDHPLGQDSPSPQAGVPDSTSTQALRDTPTTPWARLPVPQAGVPGSSSPQALPDTPTTDRCPLPPGSGAVHCRRSTAHCPQAVRQCIAGVALPAPPRQ